MRILAIGAYYPANAWRFLIDAFERDGSEVIRVGPTYINHAGIDWGVNCVQVQQVWEKDLPEWNFDECIDWCTRTHGAPDLLIATEENYKTAIRFTKDIATVFISYDGWPNAYARRELFRPTVAYTNHPLGIRLHPRTAIPEGWRYLPGACAPWVHQDLDRPRDIDFVLFATPYGQRPRICEQVAKEFRVLSGVVSLAQYVEGFNRGLATLHNCNGQEEVKWRFFEAAAMGCLIMTDENVLFKQLGYEAFMHYIPLPTEDCNGEPWPAIGELLANIRFFKKDPLAWAALVAEAKQLTLGRHTYFHRIDQIFSDLSWKN